MGRASAGGGDSITLRDFVLTEPSKLEDEECFICMDRRCSGPGDVLLVFDEVVGVAGIVQQVSNLKK